jgi:RND superfamily putative drug exporter
VEILKQEFGPGETTPILLAVQTTKPGDRILSQRSIGTLYDFVAQLQADPRVQRVTSLVNVIPGLTRRDYQQFYRDPDRSPVPQLAAIAGQLSNDSTTLITIHSRTASNDVSSRHLVQELRRRNLDGLRILVTGQTATELDTIAAINQQFPWVLAAMLMATFGLLSVLLESVVLPIKAIVMNFLSIGASFGAVVFIFQEGNFQTWFHFTPVGYLDILLPVVLFCVLFGLSMDYEVFLLTRIKEQYDRSGNNSLSVIQGLEHTGGIITSAAFLMILVTSAFAFTSIIFVKALGLGSAIAIFIDATLIRIILVPATMHLMGQWNWWSPRLLPFHRSTRP